MTEVGFPSNLGQNVYENDYYCLAEDTPILVSRSNDINLLFVKDMIDGDLVLSINRLSGKQEWKRVKISKRLAPKKIYRIRAGAEIDVTHNHKLFSEDFSATAAGNFKKGDRLLHVNRISLENSVNSVSLRDFMDDDIPDWISLDEKVGYLRQRGPNPDIKKVCREFSDEVPLTYEAGALIGLYLAEGSSSPQNSISFAFHLNEDELASFVKNTIEEIFNIKCNIRSFPQYTRRVAFIHHKAFAFLWQKMIPGDCYKKQLPSFVYSAPSEFRLGILHGWLWGDGTVSARSIKGTTASKLLVYGMHNVALSLGISSSIVDEKNSNVYRLYFSSAENISKLFPKPTIWKHSDLVLKQCQEWKVSKQKVDTAFKTFYKKGMSKKEFLDHVGFSEGPIWTVYGTWTNLLKEHNCVGWSQKIKGLSKSEILLLAREWFSLNTNFSVREWNEDPSVPSSGYIYKYFASVDDFVRQVKGLTSGDILALQQQRRAKQEKKPLVPSKKITFVENINYSGKFVYDLEVEDNENFLIGNILSHNCGAQVLIYFQDVLVDDAVRIGWSVRQDRFPVYGYASQYFGFLGAGTIIGGGSLWVTFKEAAYIPIILRHISSRRDRQDPIYASPASTPRSGANTQTSLLESSRLWESRNNAGEGQESTARRAEVERLLSMRRNDPDDATTNRELESLTVQLGALSDTDFEDAAEVFEDAIWYGGNSPNGGRAEAMSGNFAGGRITEEQFLAIRRADQFPPFDILVTFGDINNRAANHTLHRLMDVSITNTEFVGIEPTGEPILVRYDFLCRNVM